MDVKKSPQPKSNRGRVFRSILFIVLIILCSVSVYFLYNDVICPPACSEKNLTGKDFRNKSLITADFSNAVLNGADFTGGAGQYLLAVDAGATGPGTFCYCVDNYV